MYSCRKGGGSQKNRHTVALHQLSDGGGVQGIGVDRHPEILLEGKPGGHESEGVKQWENPQNPVPGAWPAAPA